MDKESTEPGSVLDAETLSWVVSRVIVSNDISIAPYEQVTGYGWIH